LGTWVSSPKKQQLTLNEGTLRVSITLSFQKQYGVRVSNADITFFTIKYTEKENTYSGCTDK